MSKLSQKRVGEIARSEVRTHGDGLAREALVLHDALGEKQKQTTRMRQSKVLNADFPARCSMTALYCVRWDRSTPQFTITSAMASLHRSAAPAIAMRVRANAQPDYNPHTPLVCNEYHINLTHRYPVSYRYQLNIEKCSDSMIGSSCDLREVTHLSKNLTGIAPV